MSDWTTDAADAIENAVAMVRERTVDPVKTATKAVVYGLLAALLIIPAALLLLVMVFRVLVIACQGEVWAAWLIMGGTFAIVGAFVWSKRGS